MLTLAKRIRDNLEDIHIDAIGHSFVINSAFVNGTHIHGNVLHFLTLFAGDNSVKTGGKKMHFIGTV